jgi:CheY-like chemotaxis protein
MGERILFVEDEFQSRSVFCDWVRTEGYKVTEARDGAEAVELLETERFDLVISDLVLPKLHGLNLVDWIRSKWPQMPLVVISGYLAEDAGKIILEGYAEFIQKPIKPEILLATVQRLLSIVKSN